MLVMERMTPTPEQISSYKQPLNETLTTHMNLVATQRRAAIDAALQLWPPEYISLLIHLSN